MDCKYKVKIKDINERYRFKIFCAGNEYNDAHLKKEIQHLQDEITNLLKEINEFKKHDYIVIR